MAIRGLLIYIKPVIYETEPRDVCNYAAANPAFPHETTVDQFFEESQFESYRMLGSHTIDEICDWIADAHDGTKSNWIPSDLDQFAEKLLNKFSAKKDEAHMIDVDHGSHVKLNIKRQDKPRTGMSPWVSVSMKEEE